MIQAAQWSCWALRAQAVAGTSLEVVEFPKFQVLTIMMMLHWPGSAAQASFRNLNHVQTRRSRSQIFQVSSQAEYAEICTGDDGYLVACFQV